MDSPPITQQTLQELESLATPLHDSWYLITAVALCSLGQDLSVRQVFQYACHDADVSDSEKNRRSQRLRDALIKAIPAIGMPKVRREPGRTLPNQRGLIFAMGDCQVLNSLQVLGSAEHTLLGPDASVSNRASEWITAPGASFMERGEAYATRLHGDQRVLDRLDEYGTADLGFIVRLCYGYILSDVTILDAADTSLAFLAALITQDVRFLRRIRRFPDHQSR